MITRLCFLKLPWPASLLCCVFVAYVDSDAAFDWTPHSNKKLTARTAKVDATSISLQLSLRMQCQLQRPRVARAAIAAALLRIKMRTLTATLHLTGLRIRIRS